jgi:hypothetical protein
LHDLQDDIDAIERIAAVPTILQVVCQTNRMKGAHSAATGHLLSEAFPSAGMHWFSKCGPILKGDRIAA